MIADFFNSNNIAFTVIGTPMSYLELLGVLTGFFAIYLASRAKVANFYVGLFNTTIYFALFYQNQLYSSMFLQLLFFFINGYGIYKWSFPEKGERNEKKELKITVLSNKQRLLMLPAIVLLGFALGYVVLRFAVQEQQNQTAIYYWDAILTIGSLFAQYLLTRKKIDNWFFWILIDLNYVVLYTVTGLKLTAILYAIYIFIAFRAIFLWKKELKKIYY